MKDEMTIADHLAGSIPAARKRSSAVLLVALLVPSFAAAADWRFELRFTEAVHREPFTGRVYLFPAKSSPSRAPVPTGSSRSRFVALDVTDWKPDAPLTIEAETPTLLVFPKGKPFRPARRVQAVARFNPWERTVGTAPGNGL